MTITIEELRKVYGEAVQGAHGTQGLHSTGLLAVARFVAERQRAVEPTDRMASAGMTFDGEYDGDADVRGIYRAMSAVAPLVVPE